MKADYVEAMKMALEFIEQVDSPYDDRPVITALREALAEQQEPVFAIRLLTNQCFALAQERDELQKQVWRYEKNGVTCQTYHHKVDASCAECNVHEVYASPPAQQQEPVAYDKTKINRFAQDLYDQKMREGKHGHYESMFHVIHQCIKKGSPPAQRKPLTEDWIRARCGQPWVFEAAKQWVRLTEAAHDIKENT